MAKFLVVFALTAVACLGAAKDRAWQNGRLLDSRDTRYFTSAEISNGATKDTYKDQYGDVQYSTNAPGAVITVYDNFMFESADAVYLVQVGRLRSSKAIHISTISPVKLAAEKNKFWFIDHDGLEYDARILKQVLKQPTQVAKQSDAKPPAPAQPVPLPTPAPVAAVKPPEPKPAPVAVKPEPAPVVKPAPVEIAKQLPKPSPLVPTPPTTPAPAPVVTPKPEPKPAPAVAVKVEPKPQPVAPKPAPREGPFAPAPAPSQTRPEIASAPQSVKDRAWQSGQLLSTMANQYFVNVTYTTDSDGATWNMTQGNDGRFTLVSQAKPYASNSTYDNYVIESQFCAYLVQRWRPKASPMVKFPGAKPLRFAVEKNKLYLLDEDGKEYETKVIKLVQRDAIDTHLHVVSR